MIVMVSHVIVQTLESLIQGVAFIIAIRRDTYTNLTKCDRFKTINEYYGAMCFER